MTCVAKAQMAGWRQGIAVKSGEYINKGLPHQTHRCGHLAHAADPKRPTLPTKIEQHAGENIQRGRHRFPARRRRDHRQAEVQHILFPATKLDWQKPHHVEGQSLPGCPVFDQRDDRFRPKRPAYLENAIAQFFAV
jgi:hypothetical protein